MICLILISSRARRKWFRFERIVTIDPIFEIFASIFTCDYVVESVKVEVGAVETVVKCNNCRHLKHYTVLNGGRTNDLNGSRPHKGCRYAPH